MKNELSEYILYCLCNIRKVRESNNKLEKGLLSFLNDDSCIMYYKNEDEIENNFIKSIELLINKDASDLIEYYLSECGCGDENNYVIKEILNMSKKERIKYFNFKIVLKNNKEIKCLIYNDKSLLESIDKIMEVNNEN